MSFFNKKKSVDLIYIEGTGDIVGSLKRWHANENVITETSRTFSGQVFEFCKKNNLNTLAISAFNNETNIDLGQFRGYSKPKLKLSGSLGYHLSQILYGFNIIFTGIRYRPNYLHITNGCTHWFMLAPLKLLGIKLFPHLHNTLWTKGYPPESKLKKILLKLDAWFLNNIASAVVCCSPEIQRQIEEITHQQSCPVYVFKPQFYEMDFKDISFLPKHDTQPFNVVFAGRIERNKGVYDLLEVADKLRQEAIVFNICGDGPELENLKKACIEKNLSSQFLIHGKLNRPSLIGQYTKAHVVIIPTRSDFAEGFAMVAAEAILLNKPIITSSIVPALEVLNAAAIEVLPESIDSYANAILQLYRNKTLYQEKQSACLSLRDQFLDINQGLTAMLEYTLTKN